MIPRTGSAFLYNDGLQGSAEISMTTSGEGFEDEISIFESSRGKERWRISRKRLMMAKTNM